MSNENPELGGKEYWPVPEEKEKFKKKELAGKKFNVDTEELKTASTIPTFFEKTESYGLLQIEKTMDEINHEIIFLEGEKNRLEAEFKKNPSLELEKELDELKKRIDYLRGRLDPTFNPNES